MNILPRRRARARRVCGRVPSPIALLAIVFALACAPAARAQERDTDRDTGTVSDRRDWNYSSQGPTRAQARAAGADEHWWENGPWSASASFGPAWFGGDGLAGGTDFAAEARLARSFSDNVSLVGAYDFLLPETKVRDAAGSVDTQSHDLHALSLGVGFRFDLTDEVALFIEPRAGVLFGSGADTAPIGLLSAGVELSPADGIWVRLAVTGLVTDSDLDTRGPNAHLDSGVMGTVGVAFEF